MISVSFLSSTGFRHDSLPLSRFQKDSDWATKFAWKTFDRGFKLFLLILLFASPVSAGDSSYTVYMAENGVVPIEIQIQIGGKSPQQVFLEYVDHLLISLDVNSDGIVTTEEANGKILGPQDAMLAKLVPQSAFSPKLLSPDLDPPDGKISRQELLIYFKRIGLQPFRIVFHRNSNAVVRNRRQRQAASVPEDQLFVRIDVNSDGKLSIDELAGALQILRKHDLDDDETISIEELIPVANSMPVEAPQQSMTESTSPFLGLASDESVLKQVRRLIDKYDSKDPVKSGPGGTSTRNQKLSCLELDIPTTIFAFYDGDGDGQLDFDELRQFLVAPKAEVTISVNLDATDSLQLFSSRKEIQEEIRIASDGTANLKLGLSQFSIMKGASSTVETVESSLKPQFLFADADSNGYLEKTEFLRVFPAVTTFENLDTDKNGKVFLEEMIAFFQRRFAAARSQTVLDIYEQGRTFFEILDTDRDRRLSYRELQYAADKLGLWDKDGDGQLSESEIQMQYRLVFSRGSLSSFMNIAVDVPGNPPASLEERTLGPIWFRKMDKNRDGDVSRREFLGDSSTFDRIDRNHDGFIELHEAEQVLGE